MSVIVLQAIMAAVAVVTFAAAVRAQARSRVVTLTFPHDLEPGRHKMSRELVLV